MAYYIMYPKSKVASVKVVTRKPKYRPGTRFGFAEGPLRTIQAVKVRLNQMSIPGSRRPEKFR